MEWKTDENGDVEFDQLTHFQIESGTFREADIVECHLLIGLRTTRTCIQVALTKDEANQLVSRLSDVLSSL